MGLMLLGSAFLRPVRHALTDTIAKQMLRIAHGSSDYRPILEVLDERSICRINCYLGLF
jgi:phosphogluconate dehydratase